MSIVPRPEAVLPDTVLNEQLILLAQTDDINQGTLDKIREEGAKIFAQYPEFFKTTFEPLLAELQKKAAAGEKLDNSDKAHIANLQDRVGALTRILLFPNNVEIDAKQATIEIDWMKVAKEISAIKQIPEGDIAILKGQGKFPAGHYESDIYDEFVSALAVSGHLKEAVAYVRKIPDESSQTYALRTIVRDALTIENQNEIIKIAQAIPEEVWQAHSLNEIALFLIKSGQLKEAKAFIRQVPKEIIHQEYIVTLKTLVDALLKKEKLADIEQFKQTLPESDQAIVVNMVNNRNKLLDIAKAGVMKNEIEAALTESSHRKDEAFKEITYALMLQNKLEEAAVVCMSINEGGQVIVDLIKILIEQKNFALAETLGLTIPARNYRTLAQISFEFLTKNQYQAAERIALKIGSPENRDEELLEIAAKISDDLPEESCRIALHLQRQNIHDSLLKDGIMALRRKNNYPDAIRYTAAIKNDYDRLKFLYAIFNDLMNTHKNANLVIFLMLSGGAPVKEILKWIDDRCVTPDFIRYLVYENLIPDSEFMAKIKHLRERHHGQLADVINAEFTRASAIRAAAFKEFLSTAFRITEPAGSIRELTDLMASFASYDEMFPRLTQNQRQELINLCFTKDPIKSDER